MNILYLTNSRIPGEKAHAIQIMKTCSALAAHVDVRIIHPRRANRPWLRSVTDLRAFYNLPCDVPCQAILSLDLFQFVPHLPLWRSGAYRIVFAVQMLTYHLALIPILLMRKADIYYTRDSLTAALLILIGKGSSGKVFYEAHSFPSSRVGLVLQRWLVPRLDGLIVLTELLAQYYVKMAIPPRRVAVIADAVDIEAFGLQGKAEARHELGIGQADFIVMYVGQMYKWKGVDTLVAAGAFLPDDVRVWLVGGTPEELPRIEKLVRESGFGRVKLVGYVPPTQIPTYLAAADVLAVPNSAKAAVSRYYTSPLKLFEYMASERPIVASDLPALREIIAHEETALLVPPDDSNAIAAAVGRLRADPALARRLAANSRDAVVAHTWVKRATRILDFIRMNDNRPERKTAG